MKAWWKKLCEEEAKKEQAEQESAITSTKTTNKTRRTGRTSTARALIPPRGGELFSSGIPVEVVVPQVESKVDLTTLNELRSQYSIDEVKLLDSKEVPFKEIELDFDTLLDVNLEKISEDQ